MPSLKKFYVNFPTSSSLALKGATYTLVDLSALELFTVA